MSKYTRTAVIPAYNEGERIRKVLLKTSEYVDETIVIDDASTDETREVARKHAKVLKNGENRGYVHSIKRGFEKASGDIIITLDADGEHRPKYIPKLVKPIEKGEADLVFGKRKNIPRPSERLLSWLARRRVNVRDSGTGFRAIRSDLAGRLSLQGYCTCGLFALEAKSKNAKMTEVYAPTRKVEKPKGIGWSHLPQFFIVFRWLLKSR